MRNAADKVKRAKSKEIKRIQKVDHQKLKVFGFEKLFLLSFLAATVAASLHRDCRNLAESACKLGDAWADLKKNLQSCNEYALHAVYSQSFVSAFEKICCS